MGEKESKKSTPESLAASRKAELFEDIENQLASVVEREGIFINTPTGRRRVRKVLIKQELLTTKKIIENSEIEPVRLLVKNDEVESLDRRHVEKFVNNRLATKKVQVPIRSGSHVKSRFVVSLRDVLLSSKYKNKEERVPLDLTLEHGLQAVSAVPIESYASISSDLKSELDPRFLNEQFTARDFEKSYTSIYGRFDPVRNVFTRCSLFFKTLFTRAVKIERQAADDLENALQTIEIRQFSLKRTLVGFVVLAFFVTLPAGAVTLYRQASLQKQTVSSVGVEGLNQIIDASKADSMPKSIEALKRASSSFRQADALISEVSSLALGVSSVLPSQYRSSRALLEVGDKSADAARFLALGLDKVFSDPNRRLDERLDVLNAYSRASLMLLADATKAANTIGVESLPVDYQAQVRALLTRLSDSSSAVRDFSALAEMLSVMAGKNDSRRYLIVFQNQTELRPTGGFMGSFAEVSVDRGEIKNIRIPGGGTYDLKGQLLARVAPPVPLRLVSARWHFQDANWFPDFSKSAEKIKWFWSKSGQSTLDGVIAVNATFVEKMLEVTGPIDMPEYGKVIDRNNFLIETQKAVEVEYDKEENTPKKFIGDLSVLIRERIKNFNKEDWQSVAKLVAESLENKDIQIALTNADEEALAKRFGWSGQLKETVGDSLAIIETNIAGQKTDGVISEKVNHQIDIGNHGKIVDTLKFDRSHNGQKGEIFYGVRNVSYLRVYVPKGSRLISASGFNTPSADLFKALEDSVLPDPDVEISESDIEYLENGVSIYDEDSRTVFAGWLQLDPGQTQSVVLSYELPFNVSDIQSKLDAAPEQDNLAATRGAYLLLLTSQSGKIDRDLTVSINVPASWNVSWSRPEKLKNDGGLEFKDKWNRDYALGALFSPLP